MNNKVNIVTLKHAAVEMLLNICGVSSVTLYYPHHDAETFISRDLQRESDGMDKRKSRMRVKA